MRISWIDSWRGILIILVVLGHVVGMSYHFVAGSEQIWMSFCYKVIYSFHMPAFFVLAGYLAHVKEDSFTSFFSRKFKRLIVPYLFWGFVSASIYTLGQVYIPVIFKGASTQAYIGKGTKYIIEPFLSILHGGGWPDGHGFQCNSVLWFLPALFIVEIVYFNINHFAKSKILQILIALVCLPIWILTLPIVEYAPCGIGQLFHYLPYFIFGQMVKCIVNIKRDIEHNVKLTSLLMILIVLHIISCFMTPDMFKMRNSLLWLFVFCAISFLGITASIVLAKLIDTPSLQQIGHGSMITMLLHKFIVLGIFNLLPFAQLLKHMNILGLLLSIIGVSALCIIICQYAYSKIKHYCPLLIGE